MPKIPEYNAQIDNEGATSRRTIESGAFDNITNPGLAWQALKGVGHSLQDVGVDVIRVADRIKRINEQDVNLYIQQKIEDQKSAMNNRLADIKATSPGAEQLDKISSFRKDYSPENIPSLAGIIQADQPSYLRDRVKNIGINDRHAAIYGMEIKSLTNRGIDAIVSEERKSREVQAIQIAQAQTTNINYDILHNGLPIEQGAEQINSVIASKADIPIENRIQIAKNEIGFAYKAYLQKAFDDNNAEVIKNFNAGEYDKQILDMPNGKEILGQLRDAGRKAGEYIQINEIYQSKAKDFNKAIDDEGMLNKILKEIQDMKNVSPYVKDQASNKVRLNINQLRESERIDHNQKINKEETGIQSALKSKNFNLAQELVDKSIYIPLEKKIYFANEIKAGRDPYNDYNPVVVADLQEKSIRINQNTPQAQVDNLLTDISNAEGFGLPSTEARKLEGIIKSKKGEVKNAEIIAHYKVFSDWRDKRLYLTPDQRENMTKENDAINANGYIDTKTMYDSYIAVGKQPREAMDLVVQYFNKSAGRSWLSNLFRGMDETKWIQNPFNTKDWIQNPYSNESIIQPEINKIIKPKTWEEYKNARP